MDLIRVKLFDSAFVYKNEKKITFPFKKAEALFYYLLVYGQATRDTLVNLLWGEVEEKVAKKNLRQAMYKIRKTFDMDIVISPEKSIVMLNPDIQIEIDIHQFLKNKETAIEVYNGEFLKGFHVKDAEEFSSWMIQYRMYLKNVYIERLNQKIEDAFSKDDIEAIIFYAKEMIKVDDFDEKAYRILMQGYSHKGEFNKVVEVYNHLTYILEKELGIAPDADTCKIFDEILLIRNIKKVNQKKESDFFYGRVNEIGILKKNYKAFQENKGNKSCIIMGEAGVGKTKLKDTFLENVKGSEILLEAHCYQAEQGHLLKPWNEIFIKLVDIIKKEKISIPSLLRNMISHVFPTFAIENGQTSINPVEKIDSLKYQVIEEAMIEVLKKVAQRRKIVLIFEDIQWMDELSIALVGSILLRVHNNICFIVTCRNGYKERISELITSAIRYNKLEKITLNQFTKSQVQEFVQMGLPKYSWNEKLYDRIYKETEGNAFFLREVLNSIKEKGYITQMSAKMQDILKSRFVDVSKEGKNLLNIVSMFFDKVNLDMLKLLSSKNVLEIMDTVEELQSREILEEVIDSEEISFAFTHQKLREFIYLQQSSGRRKILHNEIGILLEKKLHHNKSDRFLYSKLIYHFKNGGNHVFALKYKMKNLDVHFNFTHELFPVLKDGNIEEEYGSYLSQEEAIRQLQDIEKDLLRVIEKEPVSEETKMLRIVFLHMRGRYFIREGEYGKGIQDIQNMIGLALQMDDADYALKGYRQMIYYGIQIHNVAWMKKYIDVGLELAEACNYQKDTGIMLRLKGVQKIMDGDYEEAEEILKKSIRIFEETKEYEDQYTLNMAAGYNYIGEIRRRNMKFLSALEYYDRAIAVCAEKKVIHGLTIFYTNAGQVAFDMGDDDRARTYFEKAIQLYNQLNTLWGRSTAQGYMAMLLIREGNYQKALKYLMRAEKYAQQLRSPYELGLLYRIKAEVRVRMKENESIKEIFSDYLTLDIKQYCDKGIEFLRQLKDPYEIQILEILKKNS
ncbi:tetratricopeptide repeat protein [Marinisporobacter balticus]|nr:tetratricopeptide repeat protein [Marinisporobacter balticus]